MQDSILKRLDAIEERHQEVEQLLAQPEVIADQEKFRELNREYSRLQVMVDTYKDYKTCSSDLEEMESMLNGDDEDMRAMAEEEIEPTKERCAKLEHDLQVLLLPHDERDDCNCFLEIRAGTGGDEAALFAGELFRMYTKYCESKGWTLDIVSMSEGEMGGCKEVIAKLSGEGAYGYMKFESGGHRVQRVPETESQGRVHTSACTVMVLPEIPPSKAPEINPADLRIDTFRASGAGGQHINKTDSAIRITHIPTGIVVECQDQRSQHSNRARAMEVLISRLAKLEEDKRNATLAEQRQSVFSSGDRSDRIRTYNFPQSRVTDHRINLTLYRLAEIMEGKLDLILEPVIEEYQAEQLAAMATQTGL
ncbi:MAG TPA: peptide chain release factor 1 [Candidatus Anaerobiospirillum pullistercoris]|uniref:Peptide chain release factor 1 n=1 Tax=Candidatus Anaerobiospirillum pullistercoris TaxID=2838452 RepID=A0A9D1WCC0_9GAMM|nr:peptide chain release factor 1 [Candidatus Anaerobiospirillum pullistercoris]